MSESIKRPPLRYHGGKWRMADNIIPLFPDHSTYTEVFGGGASILLRKYRSKNEIYNDKDSDVVNFFKVLRDEEKTARLIRVLELTPFAREEMKTAWEDTSDDVEQARRLIVRSQMGFGSAGATKARTGFRGLDMTEDSYSAPAKQWAEYPQILTSVADRLKGVVIENTDAISILDRVDSEDTLHYVDPPYVQSTRSSVTKSQKYYRHEMTDEDHVQLLEKLLNMKSKIVISGYMNEIYMDHLKDWKMMTFNARASSHKGTVIREECVWLSPNCENTGLFGNY